MHLAAPQTQTLHSLPDGIAGIKETLACMTAYVREYKKAPEIRRMADVLTQHLDDKDFVGEAGALFDFVQNNIRYLQDIADVETLQTPVVTLENGSGDCDDKSTLLATLLESIGHKTRFIAAGFNGGDIEHVFVESRMGTKWVPMDTTESQPMGWMPPGITKTRYSNN